MLQIIKINLLPYREALAQKQKQQFKYVLLLAVLAGLGLAILGYFTLNTRIDAQAQRNELLKSSITQLDGEITQITQLKAERDSFLARKNQVEVLENKRFEAARVLDTLNTLVPDGLYLTSIAAKDNSPSTYTVDGKAISDGKIAVFMRNLPSTGLFGTPELLSIKRDNDAQSFSLQVSVNSGGEQTPPPATSPSMAEPSTPTQASASASAPAPTHAPTPTPVHAPARAPAPAPTPAPPASNNAAQ